MGKTKSKKAPKGKPSSNRKKADKAVKELRDTGAKGPDLLGIEPSKLLDEIQKQSDHCDKLARAMATAHEQHKDAKADYDSAVDRLRTLCRKPEMPLYEQSNNNDAPKPDPKD